jgi:hypothetical protein
LAIRLSVEAVASGEESAHDLTPLVRREAKEQWPVASGQWDGTVASSQLSVASDWEEMDPAVIEKRQNKANLNRTLTTCHQGIKVDTIGVVWHGSNPGFFR